MSRSTVPVRAALVGADCVQMGVLPYDEVKSDKLLYKYKTSDDVMTLYRWNDTDSAPRTAVICQGTDGNIIYSFRNYSDYHNIVYNRASHLMLQWRDDCSVLRLFIDNQPAEVWEDVRVDYGCNKGSVVIYHTSADGTHGSRRLPLKCKHIIDMHNDRCADNRYAE